MSAVSTRLRLLARHSGLFLFAGTVCCMRLLSACGSASNDLGSPGAEEAGTSAGGNASSGRSAGGAPGMGSAGSQSGAPAGAGMTSGGGAPGASGSGAGGKANNGGATGTAGSGLSAGSAGMLGGAGGGNHGCSEPPQPSALIGWAAESGMGMTTTTGGGNAAPQTVSTLAAFTSAVAGNTPKVVYVTGKLAAGKVSIGSNKTIVGLCGAEIHGHIGVGGSSNVIIRNLKIVGYGVGDCKLDPDFDASIGCSSGNDAVTINDKAHHVWVDHCDISDGTDGNLDITQGADFVTVSWTKFHYTPRTDNSGNDSTGANGHRFSNLIGGADNVAGDVGHLNVTWHHDWWADNVVERMPRTRAGKIHLFNDLFTAKGDNYCTNAGQGAALLVENSVYDGVKGPFQIAANAVGLIPKNDTFPGSTGTTTGSGSAFAPPYAYTPDATTDLQAAIMASAGPQ